VTIASAEHAAPPAQRFDADDDGVVVIIGSGAGGGTLANELCQRGVRCVVLEAGKRFTLADFENDEFAMAGKLISPVATENTSPAPLDGGHPYVCRAVGGTTLHWSGLALRLEAHELAARERYGAIDGAALADWPITPDELARYYARAEDKLGVTGTHGIPLLPANNNFKVLHAGAVKLGYRKVSTGRLAINSRARDGRPACIQMGFCLQGCRIGAKWSTLYTEIPQAEATGRCDLRTDATALQVQHDARGRATGVLYADAAGRRQFQRARAVCVAANSVESARLLLNSASAAFPDGLANSAGHIGRYYMTHAHEFVMASMPSPVHSYRGTVQAGLVEDERRHDPRRGFASGYLLQALSFGLPLTALALRPSGWGRELAELVENYTHLAGSIVLAEDMPQADNRVTLSRNRKDQFGLPIASIARRTHPNDVALLRHARERATSLYEAVGARRVYTSEPAGLTHNLGTVRMSLSARDGVVNAFGQAHDMANLFVSDGSQFPTAGAANPTLTIVALAIRQAEYIASLMNSRLI
jgi:choline dehydrogenase-like flavoprotein